jgi:hypothetical protein
MRDYKTKHTVVTDRVRLSEYVTGEYGITFLGKGKHGQEFEFTKDHQLKLYRPKSHMSFGNASKKGPEANWQSFQECVSKFNKKENLPAWLLRLARWRFINPPKFKYVEEQIGCIVYFRKVEVK